MDSCLWGLLATSSNSVRDFTAVKRAARTSGIQEYASTGYKGIQVVYKTMQVQMQGLQGYIQAGILLKLVSLTFIHSELSAAKYEMEQVLEVEWTQF